MGGILVEEGIEAFNIAKGFHKCKQLFFQGAKIIKSVKMVYISVKQGLLQVYLLSNFA